MLVMFKKRKFLKLGFGLMNHDIPNEMKQKKKRNKKEKERNGIG